MANTPQPQDHQQDRARAIWRRCLASAFRTTLACTIVGVATLYGPTYINRQVAFPAFSYVTVILIVTDATLGDTLRGCWLALSATVLGVCPGILSLWLIGPARLTTSTTAAMVAVAAFMVALPENTHLLTKRIALGQIVHVYVVAFINGAKTEPIMHPIHLAASTALGVVACVLALLLPFPNLAYCEVTENCKMYIENASDRLKLFMKAFAAEDKASPRAMICQAKSLNKAGNKFLHCIKLKQESMKWERLPIKFLRSYKENPGESLQCLDTILRGMENALENSSEFPFARLSREVKQDLVGLEEQILNQVKNMALESSVLPQSEENKFVQTLHAASTGLKDLPSLFFVFCLKLLQTNLRLNGPQKEKEKESLLHKLCNYRPFVINKRRLIPALKCSLSLGSAVLFGLMYSKENGYWSGLPVAISVAAAREATFKVANVKAQGTVLGTVYGVVGCFVFERYVKIRFVSLLPWFIFSSFLRRSQMYGQAGGVSAVIGAVLILGRKNFGAPSDFAIARIVETFIGLSCSITVDILFHPTRAAVLAKVELSLSLQSLHEAVGAMSLGSSGLDERVREMRVHVSELGKLIEEAEVEPNFWFFPFHGGSYLKLRASLSKAVDFLHFGSHALRFLEQESKILETEMWEEVGEKVETDLKVFKDAACSGVKCLHEVILVKSIAALEHEYDKNKNCLDLEMGKSGYMSGIHDDYVMKKSSMSFLGHVDEWRDVEGTTTEKSEVILSLSALVYCMEGVLKEGKEIEKGIKEVIQWENPSVRVDLQDILCKLRAVKKKFNHVNNVIIIHE